MKEGRHDFAHASRTDSARSAVARRRDAQAVARVHAQLPKYELPLSYRAAQLVSCSREYGSAGWRDLREEVLKRSGAVLIDRGVDLTIRDHRWGATAAGWAYNAAKDEEMARFLMQAEEQRKAR